MANLRQFCTFSVADLYLAIDVLEVQEVIRYQEMTRVPTAPRVVRGLINLRGQIVTAIDLRRRLDLPPAPDDQRPMNVVIRTDDGAVSLLVDEIGDVLEFECQKLERPPATVPAAVRELVTGIIMLEDRLLLVFDTARLMNFAGTPALLS
jgi:purine-binding chemotaxis protein CheW